MPDFLVIGEALIDIVERPDGRTAEHVGGSPANVALGLARLGHSTHLACGLGDDARGSRVAAHLQADGVALHPTPLARTSTAHARLDARGAANYQFDLDWQFDPGSLPDHVTHIHTGSLATQLQPGADQVLAFLRARHGDSSISFDPNIRPDLMPDRAIARARVEELVRLADVVKASDEDLEYLYPGVPAAQVIADWVRMGPAIVVATLGPDGAVAQAQGAAARFPAAASTVVDTVGAGDSFMSGLLSGLAEAGLLGAHNRTRLRTSSAGRSPGGTASGTRDTAQTQPGTSATARPCGETAAALQRASRCAGITVSRAGADLPRHPDL